VPVITAGVDLAATPERTALASIEWTGTGAVIQDVACPADDDRILDAIEQADKTGIDSPFGWPDAFVEFVTAHHAGRAGVPAAGTGGGWRRELTLRRTDLFVQETARVLPLSVSADKIAHVALRCVVLLARLDASGRPADRTGAGAVVEVYPGASLRSWGLYRRGYKRRSAPELLGRLADDLLAAAPWLDCGAHEAAIRRSHDVFDAVIAAMTARAAARCQTFPPGEEDLAAARAEGWIALPNSPIGALI
jgi:predicted nuclease with RNAse H fold